MRHDDVGQTLVRAGFTEEEVSGRLALTERVSAAFERHTGRPPMWGWFVPGRLEVFGKHTDYAGGQSLVAAVPRGFLVAAHPREDGIVSVVDARWRDAVAIDPGDHSRAFKGWTNYAAVVARRLALNFPGAPLGADIVISSDLPRAAGVSSSSALVVGLAMALARRADLASRPEWQAAIQTPFDLGGYLGAVENGLTFASLAGADGVGTHGGSQDHNAILNGRPERVSAFAYLPVRHVADAVVPPEWVFIAMSSGVRADKAGSVRGRYNRASLRTRALTELWLASGRAAGQATLGEVVADPGRAAELQALAAGGHGEFGGEELSTRLRHFVAETARVGLAIAAFRDGDRSALGELAAASQHEADHWLDNQVPETRRLAALALEHGAFASSSFGAGFGGSVWALADRSSAEDVAARWRQAYLSGVAVDGDVESFITRPSPGALELFGASEHVE